jgi:hypothetical protein
MTMAMWISVKDRLPAMEYGYSNDVPVIIAGDNKNVFSAFSAIPAGNEAPVWHIADDVSTDDTKPVVTHWLDFLPPFPIR